MISSLFDQVWIGVEEFSRIEVDARLGKSVV